MEAIIVVMIMIVMAIIPGVHTLFRIMRVGCSSLRPASDGEHTCELIPKFEIAEVPRPCRYRDCPKLKGKVV